MKDNPSRRPLSPQTTQVDSNRIYPRLSSEQWDAVLSDLKEHLKLTELLSRPTKGTKIQ